MIAACDFCESAADTPTRFDSHDGGNICNVCDKVFCPACEAKHFPEFGPTCQSCLDKAQKDAILKV